MAQAPFVVQQQLTAITLVYRNGKLIADSVLPRVPVLSPSFKYSKFTQADAFTIPSTIVGRKGRVSEIDWSSTEASSSVVDYGLDDLIPQADINAAKAAQAVFGVQPVDPMAHSTELLTDLIALDREQRVANLVFGSGNYASANVSSLSSTAQWSDYVNSDPITAILTMFDSMLIRPNIGVLGRAVYSKLRMHPKVVAAVYPQGGNAVSGGVVAQQAIADLLELDAIYIGEGFANTAKKGQTPTMARLWGKSAAFLVQNTQAQSTQGAITFGLTAEYGNRIAGTISEDPTVGLRGGTRVRVGESVQELVVANDAGCIFTTAVA
jgi:hypothetical protein